MFKARGGSYIWVTAITGLLAADDQCAWAAWFKAHFTYDKRPDDNPDGLTRWKSDHDDLVTERVAQLKQAGWTVSVEGANAITVRGRTTVGAKPDIIATKGAIVKIVDCKSGKPKAKDLWQLRVYMVLYPMVFKDRCAGKEVAAEVYCGNAAITSVSLTEADRARILDMIKAVGQGPEPQPAPSFHECRFCNILDCPDRFQGSQAEADAGGAF